MVIFVTLIMRLYQNEWFYEKKGLSVAEVFWFSETVILSDIDYNTFLQLYYTDLSPVIEMLINDFTFIFWIRYIKIKFGLLNAVLQSMLKTTIDSPQHKRVLRMKDNWEDDSSLSTVYGTYKTNENLIKLKRVKQIHLELMKCARIINEAYELQILISIFTTALFITTLSYNLYINLNIGDKWIIQLYVYLTWIFYFAIMISVKAHICETAIKEISDLTLQLIQNHLTLTSCDIFDLDYTLIRNVVNTVITYIVILIQIGNVSKQDLNENSTSSTKND
ncbi:uncharacterized protein LOC124428180 [Vespa crabro]|uniref:uncharacterized protein LOC124428180 n=1 Tax=Vespa crabro TaxID=7445 RepID=UPI001F00C909|nr:uncharacterized protein LOC124428180 [Vespa crabro]